MRILCVMIFLSSAWLSSAMAGDYFFECVPPASTYSLKEGGKQLELFKGRKKLKYTHHRQTTLRQQQGFCTTKDGQKFPWNSHQYLVELTTSVNGAAADLLFLCTQGGSGVPAAISKCTRSTSSDKKWQPADTQKQPATIKPRLNIASALQQAGSTSWSSLTDETTASAIFAWSSGCKKQCNDEVDYVPIISIDCSKKTKTAALIFWELGREKEVERQVGVWVVIDGHTTRLKARASPKLTGVSLDTTLPLSHPLFEELAAGRRLSYGSTSGTKGKAVTLNGSGKAVRRMLKACR